MTEETKKDSILPEIYEVKLKDTTVQVDGFSLQVLSALEEEDIDITALETIGLVNKEGQKPWKIIEQVLYYMVKFSSYTDKYVDLKFQDFKKMLDPKTKLKDLIENIGKMMIDASGATAEDVAAAQKADNQNKKK